MTSSQYQEPRVDLLPTTALIPIQQRNLLSLEHPCIIKNLDRGINSLGGPLQLSHSLNEEQNADTSSFPIRLRPEDIYAAPIPSKLNFSSNLLLKFTVPKRTGRKRKRGSDDPFTEYTSSRTAPSLHDGMDAYKSMRDHVSVVQPAVVGVVKHTHRYRAMSQFQYAASANPFMQDVKHKLLSPDFHKMKELTINPAQVLRPDQEIQPPPVMQLAEVPYPYSYRQNASVKIFKDQTGMDVSINSAKPGRIIHCIVEYDVEEVPQEMDQSLPPFETLDVRVRRIIEVLRAGLEDRPIMSTRYQVHLTGEPMFGSLRKALPYCGYMFRGGPFKDALIRYGLDPRKDPSYRGYQVTQVQLQGTDRTVRCFGAEPAEKNKSKQITYVFDGQTVWTEFKVYHFCDVTDPVLRKFLDNASVPDECETFAFGWYKSGTWAAFRVLLKDKIERIIKGNPKPQEWYADILSTFPDDIEDIGEPPRGGRQPPGTDIERAALLARCRGVARTSKGQGERDKERRARHKQGLAPVSDDEDGVQGADDVDDEENIDDMQELDGIDNHETYLSGNEENGGTGD